VHLFQNKAAIISFSELIEKESKVSVYELYQQASLNAIEFAGLDPSQIDGLITTSLIGIFDEPPFRVFWADQVAQFLGIKPKFFDFVEFGGPSYEEFIVKAHYAIKNELATTILCIGGGKGTVRKKKVVPPNSFANSWFSDLYYWDDFKPTSDYAMLAGLHSKRYGSTDAQRARLAVVQRANALKNPKSLYRNPIDINDVLSSPIVASPLHLLEIVPVADGAHAFIVSSKLGKIKNQPVYLVGHGEAHDLTFLPERNDILELPLKESAVHAFESSSSLSLSDLDFAQLYDSYTITTLLQLEAIGFCEIGKGGNFIENTDFSINGDLPLNTGGGSLNVGQPAYMSGGVILAEAIRQLMGKSDGYQIPNAKMGLVNAVGGNDTVNHSVTLLLSNDN
jgi:acetyl-CoA acetyltransferase